MLAILDLLAPLMKDEKYMTSSVVSFINTRLKMVSMKTIVPLLYEGRMVEQTVNRVALITALR